MSSAAPGKRHRKRNKKKVSVVFDEANRKEFLTGFRKRNQERKKKAEEDLKERLKEEKKRIKNEAKESFKKMVKTRKPIPELENLFNNEFETEEASVKIVELSTNESVNRNHWIGPNRPSPAIERKESESEAEEEDELPGMGFKVIPKPDDAKLNEEDGAVQSGLSKKEINKMIKREAVEKIQKSKAFQAKNKMERVKNKKKSLLKAKDRRHFNKKHVKTKNKANRRNHSRRK